MPVLACSWQRAHSARCLAIDQRAETSLHILAPRSTNGLVSAMIGATDSVGSRGTAMGWTHRDRIEAVLHGERADRVPVSAWHHFPQAEYSPGAFVEATVAEASRYGWDWVKINPRGVLFSEIWGAEYDDVDYLGGDVPRLVRTPFGALDDLARLEARPDSPVITEQARTVAAIRRGLPDVPLYFTVFSPLTTVLQALALPITPAGVYGRGASFGLADLWATDPGALHAALDAATTTLVALAEAVLAAGADGLFYALTGTAGEFISRDRETFETFSTPYDHRVLEAASGEAILHTCGAASHPDWFGAWPVRAINWDSFAAGNPALAELATRGVAPVGGVDRGLLDGRHADEAAGQITRTIASFGDRPFLLSPSCAIPAAGLSDGDLQLLADAVA
ncbi:MAG TPA: uroporphyrinogen decarboxylase family protein [Propionicimonas sp.]|jgi:uroporphyrinogen decarboxylase